MDVSLKKVAKLNRTRSVNDLPRHSRYDMAMYLSGSTNNNNGESNKNYIINREKIIISPLSLISSSRNNSPTRTLSNSVYSNGPGPGRHSRPMSTNEDVTLVKSPAYSIGRAARNYIDAYGPSSYKAGPASYSYDIDKVKTKVPGYSIGRESRLLNRQSSRFGPASYQAGPSTYSPERHHSPVHRLMPSFSFCKAKRFCYNILYFK